MEWTSKLELFSIFHSQHFYAYNVHAVILSYKIHNVTQIIMRVPLKLLVLISQCVKWANATACSFNFITMISDLL